MRAAVRSPLSRLALAAAVVATVAGAACVDVGTDPTTIEALEFSGLHYPSIVGGEQMLDSNGAPAPLRAQAFNGEGEPIADAPVTFFTTDTIATVNEAGVLFAEAFRASPIEVIAAVGNLSATRDVPIVQAPDTVGAFEDGTGIEVQFEAGDTVRFSDTVKVRLRGAPEERPAIPSWLVSFQVEHGGALLSPTDSAVALLVIGGTPSHVDTTDGSGIAGRQLRVRRSAMAAPLDSLIVWATARYRGNPVTGTPVRLVLYVRQ